MTGILLPGDVLAVRTEDRDWLERVTGRLIRLGGALRDQVNLDSHVAIVHHTDAAGTLWAIEGRPGGVGWADVDGYLVSPYLLTNAEQPRTQAQRDQICQLAMGLLGTPYDWPAIVQDAMDAIGAGALWRSSAFGDAPPGHVVCSSLASWIYHRVGLAEPAKEGQRTVTPADWSEFILTKGWELGT